MEWFTKLIKAIKIPLKVLLPAAWLFSGILTITGTELLENFHLAEWKEENAAILSLAFFVTSCLLLVYIIVFISEKMIKAFDKLTYKQRAFKDIFQLSYGEQTILLHLYNSPNYTDTLDYGQPVVQGLLARNYLYSGNQQLVTADVFSDSLPVKVTLQPFVYQTLDHYRPKLEKEIRKLRKKQGKAKRRITNARIDEKLQAYTALFDEIYNR